VTCLFFLGVCTATGESQVVTFQFIVIYPTQHALRRSICRPGACVFGSYGHIDYFFQLVLMPKR
jgi:hypothetical protein